MMALEYGATASNTIPVEELPQEYDTKSIHKKVKTARGYRGFKLIDPNAKKSTKKTATLSAQLNDSTQATATNNNGKGETNEM